MSELLIEARNLCKAYGSENQINVLKDLNLTVKPEETIAVLGPSGAGKSTLLNQLGLLEKPDSGDLLFEGNLTNNINDFDRSKLRLHKIGFIFQFHHLLREFSALENVIMPGLIKREDKAELKNRAAELLDLVGLNHRLNHRPGELSGGEQQRVALARALINSPKLILADEPTGNLDYEAAMRLRKLLWETCSEKKSALLIVTHNREIADFASRRVRMSNGSLLEL